MRGLVWCLVLTIVFANGTIDKLSGGNDTDPIDPTSLEYNLAAKYSCYDPAGDDCLCQDIDMPSGGYTGTIPSALSACTGLTGLCVQSPAPLCLFRTATGFYAGRPRLLAR